MTPKWALAAVAAIQATGAVLLDVAFGHLGAGWGLLSLVVIGVVWVTLYRRTRQAFFDRTAVDTVDAIRRDFGWYAFAVYAVVDFLLPGTNADSWDRGFMTAVTIVAAFAAWTFGRVILAAPRRLTSAEQEAAETAALNQHAADYHRAVADAYRVSREMITVLMDPDGTTSGIVERFNREHPGCEHALPNVLARTGSLIHYAWSKAHGVTEEAHWPQICSAIETAIMKVETPE